MKSIEWKTYRTRFLVKAKKLNYSLTFTDPLGRQHCGRKGDYLVESSDGVISIAPCQIFEDVYVPMSSSDKLAPTQPARRARRTALKQIRCEPLHVEKMLAAKILQRGSEQPQLTDDDRRSRRKSPQPVRTVRLPSNLGLM